MITGYFIRMRTELQDDAWELKLTAGPSTIL